MNWLKDPGCFVTVAMILSVAFCFYIAGGQRQSDTLLGGAMAYLTKEFADKKDSPKS